MHNCMSAHIFIYRVRGICTEALVIYLFFAANPWKLVVNENSVRLCVWRQTRSHGDSQAWDQSNGQSDARARLHPAKADPCFKKINDERNFVFMTEKKTLRYEWERLTYFHLPFSFAEQHLINAVLKNTELKLSGSCRECLDNFHIAVIDRSGALQQMALKNS